MSDYKSALSPSTIQQFIDEKRKFSIDATGIIGKAWADVQKDWGTTLITGLIFFFLGIVAPFLMGGIYIGKYNERVNGQKYEMGSLFKGFDHAGAILVYLVVMIASIMIPYILYFVFLLMAEVSEVFLLLAMLMLLVVLVAAFAVAILFFFAIPFIVFGGMEGWPAMKASMSIVKNNIGTVLIFIILCNIVNTLGVMLCYVGLLVTMPLVYIAYYYAFAEVFQIETKDPNDEILEHLV